ncbi:uncharacterized protein TNCV_3241691 [Trichonephila clavipes]|nr:uncharacterized protein TNCV_3241691 [Trichonephila clavipes]
MNFFVGIMSVFIFALLTPAESKEACEKKLHNCTGMMQPVLNEVRYMFPISQLEIEGMCKVWSHIMDCVRKYVMDCSSEEQRTKFNEAVSNSIDSVHAICSSERYRRDYLEYASCFRQVSMESCGHHFKKMVDSAYNPHSLEIHICCAYRQYEKCVSDPIQRLCGPQALHILDDSMSSLKSRCEAVTKSYVLFYLIHILSIYALLTKITKWTVNLTIFNKRNGSQPYGIATIFELSTKRLQQLARGNLYKEFSPTGANILPRLAMTKAFNKKKSLHYRNITKVTIIQ